MTIALKGLALATASALALAMASGVTIASAASDGATQAPPPGAKPKAKAGVNAKPAAAKPKPAAAAAPLPYPGGLIERHAKRLGLDDATVKEMRSIVEASRAENEKLRKRTEVEQGLLRKMLEPDVPDEKAIMAQADKIGDLIAEQRKNQLRAVLKIRSMLTPEQRAELAKIRAEGAGGAAANRAK